MDMKDKDIKLTANQIYIIIGFLYDCNTTASRRVAEYLETKLKEIDDYDEELTGKDNVKK